MNIQLAALLILVGVLLTLGASWVAERRQKKRSKHVLGSIKQKLRYTGTIKKIGRQNGGTKGKTQ